MKRIIAIAAIALVSGLAAAQDFSQARVEEMVRSAANDPDSVIFDSSYTVQADDGSKVYCGTIRTRNIYGAIVRASFVIDPTFAEMPFFMGPTPLAWIGRRLCNK